MPAFLALLFAASAFAQMPPRDEILGAMKKAASFYATKVSTHGGYHFSYTDDLSYGRSEHSETPHHVELQRDGTPIVAMAFLEAFDATGDSVYLDAARRAGNLLVNGQLCSGGWDYDIEFRPEERKKIPYRADKNCGVRSRIVTTLDDNVTQANVRFLMRLDHALQFKDAAIHEAARFALDSLTKVQYPVGAWPQRFAEPPDHSQFPVKKASYPDSWPRQWPGEIYRQHYTFNDNTTADCIDMMLEAARLYNEPRYLASAEKGGQFILLAQMPDPQPAWAQQYDANMQPAWARVFEPPSITGGESQGILRLLLLLYGETGDRKYLEPIPRALDYLKRSLLPPTSTPSEARRRVKEPAIARFYELKTNKPLYITKGTMISVAGGPSLRPDGYQLAYTDESVITHYGVITSGAGLAAIEAGYKRTSAANPSSLKRPVKLHGLSPWSDRQRTPKPNPDSVRKVLGALDARGAWTEEGTIGKANKAVSVFAAKPMVLMVNGTPTPIKENDRVELFYGTQPPRTRILRSSTFAANLELLAAAVKQ